MDDERKLRPRGHELGADLSRLSVRDLEALKAACLAEAERIGAEVARRSATRSAADSLFRR